MLGKIRLVRTEQDGAMIYGLELQDTRNLKRVVRAQLIVFDDQIEAMVNDQPTAKFTTQELKVVA